MDRAHHRFGQGAHGRAQISERLDQAPSTLDGAVCELVQIDAGAEALAGAIQDDPAHGRVSSGVAERQRELLDQLTGERVAFRRSVERQQLQVWIEVLRVRSRGA